MPKVTVHRFKVYDINTDEFVVSKRMATADAIARANGELIEATTVTIDASELDPDVTGMTARGFQPRPEPAGFQRVVRA